MLVRKRDGRLCGQQDFIHDDPHRLAYLAVADTSTSCRASVKVGHVHQGDGLDSHESGRKPSKSLISCRSARNRRAKTGREAVEAVGVVCIPLAPKNLSRARPCPPVGAFGHRGRPLVDVSG